MRIEWMNERRITPMTGGRTLSAGTGLVIACLISLMMWVVILGIAIAI